MHVGRDEYGWPRCSGSASGTAVLEPGRAVDRTLPCENTAWLPSPQICPADLALCTTRKKEKHLFLSQLGNVSMNKKHTYLSSSSMGKAATRTEIVKCGEGRANDRQLRIAEPVFTPSRGI